MIDIYEFYPRLEPHHEVEVDDEGYQNVRCPFIDATTPWSPSANPEEVGCAFCEHLHHIDNDPRFAFPHEEDGDEPPPIAGGAHGGTHNVIDYTPCRVPLRRVQAFGIWHTLHEGCIGDLYEAERRWKAKGGENWFFIRQSDTGWYSCRNSATHSRAIGGDWNWTSNPYRKPRPASGCPQQPRMREFYEICWEPLGYGWGGNWTSACDTMHITKWPNEGGDGVLYRSWPGEEDDLPYEREELKSIVREVLDEDIEPKWASLFKAGSIRGLLYKALFKQTHKDERFPFTEHPERLDNMLTAIGEKLGIKFASDGSKTSDDDSD